MHYLLSHILFLALLVPPLAAEEALLGTWEASIDDEIGEVTFRVTFRADGTFEMSQVFPDFEVPADMSELLPPVGPISYLGIGTYEVASDSVYVEIKEENWSVGIADWVEFFTAVVRELARAVADESGLADEDYPAFEQEFVDEFLGGIDTEETELGARWFHYAIEDEVLFLTETAEEGGAAWELRRVADETSVEQTTWGRLKAAWRP